MPHPSSPADVARAVLDGVSRLRSGDPDQVERLAALYAEDTWVVHPMSPGGPAALRTRDELRRHFGAGAGQQGFDRFEAVDVVVHETSDPQVVIVEHDYAVTRAGTTTRIPCVFVLRVRDGLIVESRDYADHIAAARSTGRLDALAAQLAAAAS